MAKRKKANRITFVSATKGKDGLYTISAQGHDYDVPALKRLFDAFDGLQQDDELIILPVIAELEDPALMKELRRRVADVKAHPEKAIPWETVKKKLLKKVKPVKTKSAKKKATPRPRGRRS